MPNYLICFSFHKVFPSIWQQDSKTNNIENIFLIIKMYFYLQIKNMFII